MLQLEVSLYMLLLGLAKLIPCGSLVSPPVRMVCFGASCAQWGLALEASSLALECEKRTETWLGKVGSFWVVRQIRLCQLLAVDSW